jgi:hypothetical protein
MRLKKWFGRFKQETDKKSESGESKLIESCKAKIASKDPKERLSGVEFLCTMMYTPDKKESSAAMNALASALYTNDNFMAIRAARYLAEKGPEGMLLVERAAQDPKVPRAIQLGISAVAKATANPELVKDLMKKMADAGLDPGEAMSKLERAYRSNK